MTIQSHIQKLDLGNLIEVFELDTTGIGGFDKYYFHAGTAQDSTPIVWQGITYQPWALQAVGFEVSTRGTLPRPNLRVGNVSGAISALCRAYDDLIGATIVRRRTYAIYLDNQPGADPGQHLPDDLFFVEQKVSETVDQVEFELASAMDLGGVQLPARTIIAGSCPTEYRSPECSYNGTAYFNILNEPVGALSLDVCSKSVRGCKARFGEKGRLPYGGFPAARIYRT
jgi:lambda family phage minor tail protein L